ncbi:MAG: XrtA system polysaccharide deacetylase [Pseudomonadota bacterium]
MHGTRPPKPAQPAPTTGPIVNGLSVDVEDWFQVGAFEHVIARSDWSGLECRVESNVARILELFAEANVKATFFTLGWVAERYPKLVRRVAEAGHELGSHGYDHARVFTLDPKGFAEDIRRARGLIEDAGGQAVTGYRAPSFSIDHRTPWAFSELAEQGYLYSSSVAPLAHDHYGWPTAPRFAFRPLPDAGLVELPVTTAILGGRRFAAGGGGFFRVLPYSFSHWAISQVNRREARPAMFYFHPWEIDPEQPRVAQAPLRSRLRHYTGLRRMEHRLAKLLSDFRWGRVDAIAQIERLRADDFHVTPAAKEIAA